MRAVQTDMTMQSVFYIVGPATHGRYRGRNVAVAKFIGRLIPSGTAKIEPIASV